MWFFIDFEDDSKKELSNSEQNQDSVNIETKVDVLRGYCRDNADYFRENDGENEQRLFISFMAITDQLDRILPKYLRIEAEAARFDFDENTPANGYRSFLIVVDSAVDCCIRLSEIVCRKRANTFFRKQLFTKFVEGSAHLFASLDTCLKNLEIMLTWTKSDSLFPDEERPVQEMLSICNEINQYCFYGYYLGFQYKGKLRMILGTIVTTAAIYSEFYYNNKSFWINLMNAFVSTKYIRDPEETARRFVNVSQHADVDFCKSFWFLSEMDLLKHLPSPKSFISKLIGLTPLELNVNVNGKEINVPVPSAHIGKKVLHVRLISAEIREGMIGIACDKKKTKPKSRGLIFHCHGGGFVAQSSRSHENFLRYWTKTLDVPILSIDYSLAPEAPFPRALEEVTYAYGWVLNNLALLGTTGERVVFVGDSAGANLLLSTTIQCNRLGLPLPAGLFVTYVPTYVNMIPSPARLLCMMDPLLPYGFLVRCLKAYACKQINGDQISDTESFEEITESDLAELEARKSSGSENSDTLTYGSMGSNSDENSEKYVSDFLEKYVLESETETDGTPVNNLKKECVNSTTETKEFTLKDRVSDFLSNMNVYSKKVPNGTTSPDKNKRDYELDMQKNLEEEFNFTVPQDPLMSPYCASDDELMKFPPVSVLSVHFDPCLDDCIMFAKRLKRLGKSVTLDVLKGLPHGFLNFSSVCDEAHDGLKVCGKRIGELLDLNSLL